MCQQGFFIIIALSFILSGCLKGPQAETVSASFQLYGNIGSESTYCSTVTSYSPATVVSATAQYQYRLVNRLVGLTSVQTGNIRRAEVRVLDSAGATIQCGETDGSGGISISIPRTAGTYTLKVYSRAENSYVKASVLNNPTAMTPYSISATFTLTGAEATKSVTLTAASYEGTLEGGAFNILDQIYVANEYLRNNSSCAALGSVCTAMTGAVDKVRIFWTPGLSPGAYYQSPTAAISFFIADAEPSLGMASGIYMMGGINGSVCVDTDHYDNSVIIHEYGHFLESAKAYTDSPGGSHDGSSQIDARLAWSEGWSNFLQGAVLGDSYYVDTTGNQSCSGGTGITVSLDLENKTQDVASQNGEGIFREVSVSRVLYDTINAAGADGEGANVGFGPVWKVFTDSTTGFRTSTVRFRNMGHFNELLRTLINASGSAAQLTAFDSVLTNEKHRSDRLEYAYPVSAQSAATCTTDLQGISGSSNYAKTMDFLSYYYDGSSAHSTITLKYAATPLGTPTDLDLYVWKEDHAFSDTSTLAGSSARFYPESGSSGQESVSLAGLSAGYYLIHVVADPDNVNTTARYYLETNSGAKRLCP